MHTTDIHALLEPDAPVIRYIGQGVEPKPAMVKKALPGPRRWRRLVLHEAVPVGDVASFFQQEEVGHAIRAGHPLLNAERMPVNLLEDPEVRQARDAALTLVGGDPVVDAEVCASLAGAGGQQISLAPRHPVWRLDVRPLRTSAAPDGFRTVRDDNAATAPILAPDANDDAGELLRRFAVPTTAEGLRAIHEAEVIWSAGPRARWNPDATSAHFVNDGVAELRMPRRVVGAVLDRHVPGAVEQLAAMPGMEVGRRDALWLSTTDPEQLRSLSSTLIDFAVLVDRSDRKPTRQATTSHDTQQILLRASQALVLADLLTDALAGGTGATR